MQRRGFLGLTASAITGLGAFFASIPFVKSFLPSARARGLAGPIEVDVSRIAPGAMAAYSYRGDTMLVLRRTPEMLARLASMAEHRFDTTTVDPPYVDPEHRAIDPEYLVLRGVCTHLGCVPRQSGAAGQTTVGEWWTGGLICPCHQSSFDYTGRVVRGPAPSDLPIPPHRYVSAARLVIGEATEST